MKKYLENIYPTIMRTTVICVVMLITAVTLKAQTVSNPDFELTPPCPTTANLGSLVIPGWAQPTDGTADFLRTGCYLPNPFFTSDNVTAQSGDSFVGVIVEQSNFDYKEYLTNTLSTPLVAGTTYNISFYIRSNITSPNIRPSEVMVLPVSERGYFGLMFSTTAPTSANTTNGSFGSIVNTFAPTGRVYIPASNTAVYTSGAWTQVTLSYTATGGEQYMTVGQFRPGVTSNTANQLARFYFDNFSNVVPAINASLTKSVSPTTIVSGGTATYTFTVNNTAAGNTAQTGISFTDALPSGLRIAATPNVVVTGLTDGTTTATAGGTSVGVSGYSIAAGATGTITVNVTNAAGQTNTTCPNAAFTNAGTNVTGVSANLTNNIGAGPCLIVTPVNASLSKSVSPTTIVSGGTATYTFTVNNSAAGNSAQTGISFTDALPSGLRIAATPNVVVTGLTGGTTTAAAGGTSVGVSGYSIAAGVTGTLTVNVTNAAGQTNTTCPNAAFTNAGTNVTGVSANLTNNIGAGPCLLVTPVNASLTKSVSPTTIVSGGTATYTFTVDNTAVGNSAQTGISFTDALPSGLRIAATPNVVVTGLTGGTTTATAGGTSVGVSGYSIAAGATGTITVNVTNAAGQTNTTCPNAAFTNTNTNVTGVSANLTNNIGAGPCLIVTPVNASLTKSVSPSSIVDGGIATYTFTVDNTATGNSAQSGISFTDAMPSGLKIASTPNVVVTGLTGGTVLASPGGNGLSVSGYSIAAGATGTITVNVTNAAGQTNTTCPNAAFTNANTNVTGVSANLTNNIGAGPCLIVTPACTPVAGTVTIN